MASRQSCHISSSPFWTLGLSLGGCFLAILHIEWVGSIPLLSPSRCVSSAMRVFGCLQETASLHWLCTVVSLALQVVVISVLLLFALDSCEYQVWQLVLVWHGDWLTIICHLCSTLKFRLLVKYFRDVMGSIWVWFCLLSVSMWLNWPVLLWLKSFTVVGNRGRFANFWWILMGMFV